MSDLGDEYKFWKDAISGKQPKWSENSPQPGWYCYITKDGRRIPVQLTQRKDGVGGVMGFKAPDANGKPRSAKFEPHWWSQCATRPISEAAFKQVWNGGEWPDLAAVQSIGNNQPPEEEEEATDDPLELLRREFKKALAVATALADAGCKNQDEADALGNAAQRLAGIKKKCDDAFTVEKKPWLDGGREVDNRWRNIRETIEERRKDILRPAQKWAKAEDDKRKAEAAELAAKANAETTLVAAAPVRIGGAATGRRMSMREFKSAKIVDYEAALAFVKGDERIREAVLEVCNVFARTGTAPSGCGFEIITEERMI